MVGYLDASNREEFTVLLSAYNTGDLLGVFYDKCHGGEAQRVVKTNRTIEGEEYCLYGKTDIYFPHRIVDIKTTGRWKGDGSFLGKTQHKLYALASGIADFEYLVAVFDDETSTVVDVHSVPVTVEMKAAEAELTYLIRSTINFLKDDKDLYTAYLTKFNRF